MSLYKIKVDFLQNFIFISSEFLMNLFKDKCTVYIFNLCMLEHAWVIKSLQVFGEIFFNMWWIICQRTTFCIFVGSVLGISSVCILTFRSQSHGHYLKGHWISSTSFPPPPKKRGFDIIRNVGLYSDCIFILTCSCNSFTKKYRFFFFISYLLKSTS